MLPPRITVKWAEQKSSTFVASADTPSRLSWSFTKEKQLPISFVNQVSLRQMMSDHEILTCIRICL